MSIDPRLNKIDSCLYRVAVKALILNSENNVLIGLEDNGLWSFPGGGIDHGEDEITALYREIYEEIGVKKEYLNVYEKNKHIDIGQVQDGIPKLNIFYMVKTLSKDFKLDEELSEIKWVSFKELNNMKISGSIGDINKIITFLKTAN